MRACAQGSCQRIGDTDEGQLELFVGAEFTHALRGGREAPGVSARGGAPRARLAAGVTLWPAVPMSAAEGEMFHPQ